MEFEQMRFNLHTPADPSNMATRFKLRPTPIVLERVPSSSALPHNGPMPFDKRMAIASRLAQREIESSCSDTVTNHYQLCGEDNKGSNSITPAIVKRMPNRVSTNPSIKPVTIPKQLVYLQHTKQKKPSPNTTFKQTVTDVGKQTGVTKSRRTNVDKMEDEIDSTSHEILRLRKDLTRKMQKLKILSLRADLEQPTPRSVPTNATIKPSSNRLTWLEEDKLVKKQKIKTQGQTIRNARLLYQLQQKVQEAQSDINGTDHSSKDRLLAMHKLASAHRAAIRTLHHLSSIGVPRGATRGYPQKSPSHDEIIKLIEQLSRLCVDANVGGVNNESEDERMTSVLKELHDYHTHVKQLLSNNRHDESIDNNKQSMSPVLAKRRTTSKQRKNPPLRIIKHGGIKQRNRIPHFARQTFASTLKNSKDHTSQQIHQSSDTRPSYRPHPHPIPPPSPLSHVTQGPSSSQVSLSLTPSIPSPSQVSSDTSLQMPWEHNGQNIIDREMARQSWLDRQALQLAQKRRNGYSEEKRRRHSHVKETNKMVEKKSQEKKRDDCNRSDEVMEDLLKDINRRIVNKEEAISQGVSQGEKEVSQGEKEVTLGEEEVSQGEVTQGNEGISGIQLGGLENILSKIEEMERERLTLQRKWQTISYDSNELVTGSNNIIRPINMGPITVSISDKMLTNIGKYKNEYNHYLKMTGVKLDRRFNPLQLVDSICDDIFDELLQDTCIELLSTTETTVEQLYNNEFHNAS